MGIKSNFLSFLKSKSPESFEVIHLSEYAFKKVAIDVSLYMHKFKAVCGDYWLISFINLVACLRKNEVHCVFIYDGQAPIEKQKEQEKRKNVKMNMIQQIKDVEESIVQYTKSGVVNDILIEFNLKATSSNPKRLLTNKSEEINIKAIREKLKIKKSQIISINSNDYQLTRDLFDILQVPYYIASNEAEKMCSKLCIDNEVDAVLSEDTDTLAYGTPFFLSKIDINNSTCVRVDYNSLLEKIDLTREQFLDFCILCGTDYNNNIQGVGSVSSFKLIKTYGSLEEIEINTKYDTSVLNYNRVRQLFTDFNQNDIKSDVPYCSEPDFDILRNFLNSIELRINYEYLQKCFIREIIIMEDDENEVIEKKEEE
jgi:5'-3' exonuclease